MALYKMPKDDSVLQRMAAELHLQDCYKALAKLEMRKPIPNKTIYDHDGFINQRELLNLYNNANRSLLRGNAAENTVKTYVKRFRHFVQLFFAYERLELERKYKDKNTNNVRLRYICHRTGSKKKNKKAPRFAVYVLWLPSQSMEDIVLYQRISIDKNEGKITRIYRDESKIEVSFKDKKGDIFFNQMQFHSMVIKFNECQYDSWMHSMDLIEEGRISFALFPDASKLMSMDEYKKKLAIFDEEAKNDSHISKFDMRQRQAIFSVVNGVHGTVPFIIWGPPGTGKTVTIVECVRQLLLKDETNRILICTPSNTAADLIARRILDAKDSFKNIITTEQMCRYYSLGRNVNDRDRALDEIIRIREREICALMVDRFGLDTYEEMKKIRLIFSTLACSSYFEEIIEQNNYFSHIFIDEAGQSLEPETMIPICRYATEKTRVILCGDHEQLGPVVKANFLKPFKSCNGSLMERLMRKYANGGDGGDNGVYLDGRTFCQLTDSYRCHPKIIQFSSEHFYKGTLQAVNEENRSSFCAWKHLPKKDFPIILHIIRNGAEVKQLVGHSIHNQQEIDVVLKYIKLLKNTMKIKDQEIGVISPYKQQTQKIRDSLRGRKITVDSVECYQGSERRVIILTLARSEQIGFLSEYKRLNTSLTRAKELLIIVVSLDFVRNLRPNRQQQKQNYWIPFIEYCADNDAVLLDEFAGEDGKEMDSKQMKENVRELRKCLREAPNNNKTVHEERSKKPLPLVNGPNPVNIPKKKEITNNNNKMIQERGKKTLPSTDPNPNNIPKKLDVTKSKKKTMHGEQSKKPLPLKDVNPVNIQKKKEITNNNKSKKPLPLKNINPVNIPKKKEITKNNKQMIHQERGKKTLPPKNPNPVNIHNQQKKKKVFPKKSEVATKKKPLPSLKDINTAITHQKKKEVSPKADGGSSDDEETDSTGGWVNCLMICGATKRRSIAETSSLVHNDDGCGALASAMQRLGTAEKTTGDKLALSPGSPTSSKASSSSFDNGTNCQLRPRRQRKL